MRIAMLGATGRTGRHALKTALERGHEVTVLVRDPGKLPHEVTDGPYRDRVRVLVGDATDPDQLVELVAGADAVVSALGPVRGQRDLHRRTARALTRVMKEQGPRRFVGISAAGIDVPGDQKPLRDKVISWLIQRLGGDAAKDKPEEFAVWAGSGLDWTLVRVPRLQDRDRSMKPLQQDPHRSTRSTTLSRADLGAFLIDVVEQNLYACQAPFVATP
jgi:uncharacterized protein YbjT (DUF2867 family)